MKFQKIQNKITFWAGLCLLLTAGVLITFSIITLFNTSATDSEQLADANADSYGQHVKAEMEVPLDMARSAAQMLEAMKAPGHPGELSREEVSAMMKEVLLRNPAFIGTYTLWEPGAFDDNDQQYINAPGHDQTGRFMFYWTRGDNGQIELQNLEGYETSEWYQYPKRNNKEAIIGPLQYVVQGKNTWMISLVVPIQVDGKFVGIAGIDYPVTALQQWAGEFQGFDGQGKISLITNDGLLAAAQGHADAVGKQVSSLASFMENGRALTRIQSGHAFSEYQQDVLEVFVPITFGQANIWWAVNVSVPRSAIYKNAYQMAIQQGIISVGVGVLALVVLWFVALQITRPIQELTAVAKSVANGNLDQQAAVRSNDEIGTLAEACNQMVFHLKQMLETERDQSEYLQNKVKEYVEYMSEVGRGNLAVRLKIRENGHGTDDPLIVLACNLNDMTASIQTVMSQTSSAANNLSSASTEILSATTQQASGASEQSSAIAQVTTTVEEVKALADQSVLRAQEVVEASNRTVEVSQDGLQTVHDTINSMTLIKERVEGVAENILKLSKQTQQIDEIITTVSEIAAQSNMLALNAAVEAARAGEHGRGFAVVAAEVRSLAEQSRQATVQVKTILHNIQIATNTTVMATEEGTKVVEQGAQMAIQTQATIEQLSSVIKIG